MGGRRASHGRLRPSSALTCIHRSNLARWGWPSRRWASGGDSSAASKTGQSLPDSAGARQERPQPHGRAIVAMPVSVGLRVRKSARRMRSCHRPSRDHGRAVLAAAILAAGQPSMPSRSDSEGINASPRPGASGVHIFRSPSPAATEPARPKTARLSASSRAHAGRGRTHVSAEPLRNPHFTDAAGSGKGDKAENVSGLVDRAATSRVDHSSIAENSRASAIAASRSRAASACSPIAPAPWTSRALRERAAQVVAAPQVAELHLERDVPLLGFSGAAQRGLLRRGPRSLAGRVADLELDQARRARRDKAPPTAIAVLAQPSASARCPSSVEV